MRPSFIFLGCDRQADQTDIGVRRPHYQLDAHLRVFLSKIRSMKSVYQ